MYGIDEKSVEIYSLSCEMLIKKWLHEKEFKKTSGKMNKKFRLIVSEKVQNEIKIARKMQTRAGKTKY